MMWYGNAAMTLGDLLGARFGGDLDRQQRVWQRRQVREYLVGLGPVVAVGQR